MISSLASSSDIQHFFQTFLTEEEKVMLTKRLMLHLMLENKYSYSEITEVLSVSNETVYKHKLVWEKGDETYKTVIAKIAKKKKTSAFWLQIEKFLRPLELGLEAKTNMKARAKLMSRDYE